MSNLEAVLRAAYPELVSVEVTPEAIKVSLPDMHLAVKNDHRYAISVIAKDIINQIKYRRRNAAMT